MSSCEWFWCSSGLLGNLEELYLCEELRWCQRCSGYDIINQSTYLTFQGKIFEQVKGAAMVSPISPIVANLFMEDLEIKALSTAPTPPTLWKRFVDDTFIIIQRRYKESFLQHLNSIDDNIHFTCEEGDEDGSIAFLDILITPDENGRLNTSVYRKATHTDQYLHWDSHHAITSKYSVVGTLFHRARTVCSKPVQLQKEERHLYQSLRKCKYPDWAINRMKLKSQSSCQKRKKGNNNQPGPSNIGAPKPYIGVPYHQGLSESYKNICKKYGIEVHLKGGHTIKDLLMAPKDKDPILKKVGSYIDISVTGWIVMMSILESQQEILKRGTRNISRPHPPFMTTLTSLVMMSPLTTLPYWGERTKTS